MAEVEISTEHDHASDPFGRRVGVIAKTEANDEWTFFQAKKIREHLLDVGAGLATALGGERDNVRDLAKGYLRDRDRYKGEADVIEAAARAKETQSAAEERRALWLLALFPVQAALFSALRGHCRARWSRRRHRGIHDLGRDSLHCGAALGRTVRIFKPQRPMAPAHGQCARPACLDWEHLHGPIVAQPRGLANADARA